MKEVQKYNEPIQKSWDELSAQQQRVILYLISKIGYDDDFDDFKEYEFSISEFCQVCGIPIEQDYVALKEIIKNISDKNIWVQTSKDTKLVKWIGKVYIYRNYGTIKLRFYKEMKPFFLELKRDYTTGARASQSRQTANPSTLTDFKSCT